MDRPHRPLLLALCAAAAVDAFAIWRLRERLARARALHGVLVTWNAAHIAVGGVLAAFDGGVHSPFVSICFVSVAFAAVALPKRMVLLIAALDAAAVGGVVAATPADASPWEGAVWAAAIVVIAAVCMVIAEERSRRVGALGDAKEEMLRRLARVVEFRDDETAGHVERMSAYTEVLARRLGLGDLAADMRLASTMHDVGKVAVPDAVLRKPGRLDAGERAIMERHAETGHRMLVGSGSDLLDLAATIALTHHERFDGTGYPHRLAGDQIPLAGRIVAVADVFDALTSDRVYKRAIAVDEAASIIREEAGAHFDPLVVGAFEATLDELRAIRLRHQDRGPGRFAVTPSAPERGEGDREGRLRRPAPAGAPA